MDLDRMKDFDLERNQIRQIEIKKPGLLGSGHFIIHPNDRKTVKITLRNRIAYDRVMQLIQAFSPEDCQFLKAGKVRKLSSSG